MKRKVQAQRKFAQGAYIPPHTNNNVTVDRRVDLTLQKDSNEPRNNIFHNKTSAKNLLDVVCFQNVHTHLQPIVLLERLQEKRAVNLPIKPKLDVTPAPKPLTMIPDATARCIPVPKLTASKKYSMCLRSQSRGIQSKINKKIPKPSPKKAQRASRLDSCDFCTDDDKPLTYFTKRATAIKTKKTVKTPVKSKPKKVSADDSSPVASTSSQNVFVRSQSSSMQSPAVQNEDAPMRSVSDEDAPMRSVCDEDAPMRSVSDEKPPEKCSAVKDEDGSVASISAVCTIKSPGEISPAVKDTALLDMAILEALVDSEMDVELPKLQEAIPNTAVDEKLPDTALDDAFPHTAMDEAVTDTGKDVALPETKIDETSFEAPIPIAVVTISPEMYEALPDSEMNEASSDNPNVVAANAINTEVDEDSDFEMDEELRGYPHIIAVKSMCDPENEMNGELLDNPFAGKHVADSSTDIIGSSVCLIENPLERSSKRNNNCNTSSANEDESVIGTDEPATTSRRSQSYYGLHEINNWVYKSQQRKTFKVPHPPNKKKSEVRKVKKTGTAISDCSDSVASSIVARRNSLCPSESYSTVEEVVAAPRRDLDRRCRRCEFCESVSRILRLSNLFKLRTHRRINETQSDIYEFNADFDTSSLRSNSYSSKRKERTARKFKDQCVNTDGTGDLEAPPGSPCDTFFVNLTKERADTVIEMNCTWIENQKTYIIRSDKVPRRPDIKITDLSMFPNASTVQAVLLHLKKLHPERAFETSSGMKIIDPRIPGSEMSVRGHTLDFLRETEQQPGRSRDVDVPINYTQKVYSGPKPNQTNTVQEPKPSFPKNLASAEQVDAPVFYPTEAQFKDPIAYFNEILPTAAKFGMCKVVAPEHFKPSCTLNDDIRFGVTNQYIARLYTRWGPASREMSSIKAYLASQSVVFTRPPLLDGVEVNLPKLYHLVQRCGGLKKVIEKKRWSRVADEMSITKTPQTERKLDQIYVKYILPYDTLSNKERQEMLRKVEIHWNKKNQRMLDRAMNPLHRQKRILGESESSEEENDDDSNVTNALVEAEDCVVSGRQMNLATFKKVAAKAMKTYFSGSNPPTSAEVENAYWKTVLLAGEHVCVNTASIDTGEEGYGFTKSQCDPYVKHPWNLKMLSENSGNILRSLGPVLGVTVPTLHLGMVYSTSCWHRDPHGLPWIEYMHTGPGKIWYGIPDEQSSNFRRAVEFLCPTSCQNKSIWLSSDITMIPPNLLLEHNVSLSRVVQKPGEFIVVFPKAYSCSISTGYTESESVYFAPTSWLKSIHQVFHEVRESCEPTMFSLEQLLLAAARDTRASLSVLQQVHTSLSTIIDEELSNRAAIQEHGVQSRQCKQSNTRPAGAWNIREQDECQICRATLYLSRVRGLTDKKSSVCLQHALRLLDATRRPVDDVSPIEMEIFFTQAELENYLQIVQKRLLD